MNDEVRHEVLRLTEAISVASEQKDRAALESILDDGFVLTLSTGKTFNKAQMIEFWASDNPSITDQSHGISDQHVYVYGDTAIVVAIITDRWRDAEGEKSYQERIFDVWRRSEQGWRLIASKPTKMP